MDVLSLGLLVCPLWSLKLRYGDYTWSNWCCATHSHVLSALYPVVDLCGALPSVEKELSLIKIRVKLLCGYTFIYLGCSYKLY